MILEEFLRENSSKPVGSVISAIARTSLKVWEAIPFRSGLAAGTNPSGERQTEIDVFANDIFVEAMLRTNEVSEVASEEMPTPKRGPGTLHVSMDPLDGSSNVETNNPLGSIFGLYEHALPCSGENLASAAYVTYGPMLTLTFAVKGEVRRFVAVRDGTEFRFSPLGSVLVIPSEAGVYGFGGPKRDWIPQVQSFVAGLEERGMKVRYCGTFVGDFNQILKYGGVFAYPALKAKPKGKLRVLYESAPMAFIAKSAGGYATDGSQDLLKLVPKRLAETSPVYLGSRSIVHELERAVSSG